MNKLSLFTITIFILLANRVHAAALLPSGGEFLHGNGVISSQRNQMAISSTSKNNVISWNDFSVGKDHLVQFDNKNYLNLIRSSNPSVINGTIQSLPGGKVYIVNPNGITLGKDSSFLSDGITLSTSKVGTEQINAFLEGNGFVPSKKGMGNITLLGKVTTKNLLLDGNRVLIKDIGNISYGTMISPPTNRLTNVDGEKFVIYSSSKRIDIGGSKDINLKEDYGFTKENGTVSQLGKTAISDKNDFLNIQNDLSGEYFITNDINLGEISNAIASNSSFTGKLDGAYNTISYTLKTDNPSNRYIGLFGKLDNAIVENIKIENSKIELDNISDTTYVGGLAGSIKGSHLANIQVNNLNVAANCDTLADVYIGGITGSFDSSLTNTTIENISSSLDKNSQYYKVKIGIFAGINNDDLKFSGSIFANEVNLKFSEFGKNNSNISINNSFTNNSTDYIKMDGLMQNKNFYCPYFIDSDFMFIYDNSNPKEYNYAELVNNPYFRHEDYVDISYEYTDPIKYIGVYSHVYNSKENGTKYYFVHNNTASQRADHKIKITGIDYKENLKNHLNLINKKIKYYSQNYKSYEAEDSLDTIDINKEEMNTDSIYAYRLNLSEDFIFNPKFLASVGISKENTRLVAMNSKNGRNYI